LSATVYDNHMVDVCTGCGTWTTTVTYKQFADWSQAVMAEVLKQSLKTMGGWIS
jgi:hypothetical protein